MTTFRRWYFLNQDKLQEDYETYFENVDKEIDVPMDFYQDINENIERLKICQWAYGWTNEELFYKIREMISDKQFKYYFKQEEENKKLIDNLIFEIKNKNSFDTYVLKEDKNRSYGNKYIKRKYRF